MTIIEVPWDKVVERLGGTDLPRWTTGWGNYKHENGKTCLHGAIRYCQPVPGDAYIVEQVANRHGWGIGDNDTKGRDWTADLAVNVRPDITDAMLEATFGRQWEPIVALVRRAATPTDDDVEQLAAARDAARPAARPAAWAAAAAWDAAWDAAWALVVRDLINPDGPFTADHYRTLTAPWATAIGPAHPDDVADGIAARHTWR